ncbi:DNA-binding transcriptional activator PspC [Legionella massiliensis]|uniref:DNA-binding transcriptional activator PspC n=1 Tax=Legionella massiliensis TaxID=1034943 RepID=A0A078KYJ2_9GAMM|nr:PspC domain-containing protein [Legionella massiliensis]CDZ76818.1 DNA-binding transcriptional activator PspC [Legionella massiliensis]CEE12556.1 DNA-binding transcriptional activator PspC [Legionella massiliensis]
MKSTNGTYKKLYRSRDDKKIAGVCGGLGNYFNIDPIWVRIFFIIFFLVGGAAFIVYVVLWLLVPLEPLAGDKNIIKQDSL